MVVENRFVVKEKPLVLTVCLFMTLYFDKLMFVAIFLTLIMKSKNMAIKVN